MYFILMYVLLGTFIHGRPAGTDRLFSELARDTHTLNSLTI